MSGNLFVFGYGYSAAASARILVATGWHVAGTVRNAAKFEEMRAEKIRPLLFHDEQAVCAELAISTHLLVSAPPGPDGDPVFAAYRSQIEKAPQLRWAGYFSTVGVYGDHGGEWIGENAPLRARNSRGIARIKAEAEWMRFCKTRNIALDIFRLAGIYGPGRSPLDKLMRGDAVRIIKPGQVFNRIHVADIAQIVASAISKAGPARERIFNIADDEPAPPQDVVSFAAQLLGAPPPPETPFEKADLSPMGRSFYEDNKRVRNEKVKRELGVTLKYPTYRDGLAAIAAEYAERRKPPADATIR